MADSSEIFNLDWRISGPEEKLASFIPNEPRFFLFLHIFDVRGLVRENALAVHIKFGNHSATTKYSTQNWNQSFAFTNDHSSSCVEILLKEYNSDFIGKLTVEVSEIPILVTSGDPVTSKWYKLDGHGGELRLKVLFRSLADDMFLRHSVAAASNDNIRSQVYLSPRLWYLRVNIIEALGLVLPMDKNRISGVYVNATLGNVKLRTKVSSDQSFPKWNEDLMFVAEEPFYEPLILTVEDNNNTEVISLGSCKIHLSSVCVRLLPEPVGSKLHKLTVEDVGVSTFAGELHTRISLDGGYHVFDELDDFSSDYRATCKELWPSPIGVLELGIISASGLVPMSGETRNAYCVAKYGPRWFRTRTALGSLNPIWNDI